MLTNYCIYLYNTKLILSYLNKQTLTLLAVTTTLTRKSKEGGKETKEAMVAKIVVVKEIV